MWKKILAYAVFAAGAMVCIWFIDRRVDIPGRDLPRPVFQQ